MSTILSHTPTITHEPIEAGNHLARCISIIDLGTQKELKFESDEEVEDYVASINEQDSGYDY